jgi:NADPH2 dehydrogenase
MSSSKLFSPIRIGRLDLAHRVVLAPLTRVRANSAHVHSDLAVTYYGQRATTPGTLLISEATLIAPQASGHDRAPGIWSKEQVEAWKKASLQRSAIPYSDTCISRLQTLSTESNRSSTCSFGL